MEYQTIAEVAQRRRSIRKFTDDPVSREKLEKIVNVGMHAPSAFNAQMWEMVAVDDAELRSEITQYILDGMAGSKGSKGFKTAPVFLLVYGDERTRSYGPAHLNGNEAWWEFSLNTTLACSFMNMQLAATSLGLGSMWVSAFRNPTVQQRTRQLLDIPDHLRLFEMMAVGYPAIRPGKKKMRSLDTVLHYNRATNYRTAEELEAWF